jgi:hypothetical protein
LKGKIAKRDVLCLLDIGASHNFITRENAERMELPLEKLKAPIEVHFANGVPHPTTLQAKEVPLQLGNWRGKVDLLISTLGGMDCILGMEFIAQNNVLIEGRNRLVRIPSKSGIVQVKAHELPCVSGPTIHFMLGKTWKKECVGGHGMLCVMRVLDEYEPGEVTKLATPSECIRRVLEEFPDVMLEDLPEHLPPRRRVAPLLWPSVRVKPNTWKSRELESSGTPECSDLNSKAQNTSPWGVLGVIGKVSKCRCPKWPRIGHLDIFSPSYGQKKGRESNWQFDSQSLKVKNRPVPNVRSGSATRR